MRYENEELACLIQSGKRERIPELWQQVEKFISMQAGKRARQLEGFGGVTAEDLYQSGFLALVEAVDTFDLGAGRSFVSWLSVHLKTAFAEAAGYRSTRRDMLDYAGDLDVELPDMDGVTVADTVSDPNAAMAFEDMEDKVWREQLHAVIEDAFGSIPEERADILRRRFYQKQTLAQIAAETDSSVEKIRLKENRALQAMRNPRILRELEQFIEEQTPYYHQTGLSAFLRDGSQVERLVIRREEKQQSGTNANWCSTYVHR